uniref:Uncharacterized protein n=1 Tax=Amphimedon queenslandica TaxID=400682 RepID=A0A1X7SI18_AMPQE
VDELTIIKEQLHRTASATKDSLLKSDQQLDNKLDEMKQQFSIYSCQKQEIEELKDEIK